MLKSDDWVPLVTLMSIIGLLSRSLTVLIISCIVARPAKYAARRRIVWPGIVIGALTLAPAPALAVSGILNSYASVSAVSGSTLTVSTTSGFNVGDRVLVIQMQGASVNTSDTANHGDIAGYGGAGTFEYGTIASIGAGSVTLSAGLANSYSTSGNVQVVRVASYGSVTVDGTVTAPAWNGSTGGVVAIDASGTLTLSANISASLLGFRGGTLGAREPTFDCIDSDFVYTDFAFAGAGNKGEGIAKIDSTNSSYRGKRANGGGGGNPVDSGGGGGGNYGAGGNGGHEDSRCGDTNGGLGGAALSYGTTKLFMGGGGGSGSKEGTQTITGTATAGGGMIFLRAGTLVGNGGTIQANGASGSANAGHGSDGGGAGGAIAIRATSVSGTVTVQANGGSGGSDVGNSYARGPGGGGGGGVVATAGVSCGSFNTSTSAGLAGFSSVGSGGTMWRGNFVVGPNWGANSGTAGACITNFAIPSISGAPNFTMTKTSAPFAGGSNGGFLIPQNFVEYTITITNGGSGACDAGSMIVVDPLPSSLTFFNGDHDGSGNPLLVSNGSGASCCSAANVVFRNAGGANLSPQPGYGSTGLDPTIRQIAITPTGALNPGASMTIKFRVQIN